MTDIPSPPTTVSHELVDESPLRALSSLFDDGIPSLAAGDPLPPLWHWVALARWPASTALGLDGHPRRGTDLPTAGLPRRMFAGGEVRIDHPIPVGSVVRREARTISAVEKSGRSGRFVVATVETCLFTDRDTPALTEHQNIVYRPAPDVGTAPLQPAHPDAPRVGPPLRRTGDGWAFDTDPTVLVRFSAATSNAHRIHYDWPYATAVEGYPGLVVHGPLMTLALAEVARVDFPDRPARIRHRNTAPLFCGRPAYVVREPTESGGVVLTMQSGPRNEPTSHTTLTVEFD